MEPQRGFDAEPRHLFQRVDVVTESYEGAASSGAAGGGESVLKGDADKIALPPDHATFAHGVKFVERQFEIQRQQIEAVEFDPGTGIGDVLNAAREDAALCVEEQQRVFRNCRPRDRSAFEFHPDTGVHACPGTKQAIGLPPGRNQLRALS